MVALLVDGVHIQFAFSMFEEVSVYEPVPEKGWENNASCLCTQLNDHLMNVALWAFLSRISDPRFGGMYTTLFSAMSTIGIRWPISVCLWLLDAISLHSCSSDEMKVSIRDTVYGTYQDYIFRCLYLL